jgi:hypothetical protein
MDWDVLKNIRSMLNVFQKNAAPQAASVPEPTIEYKPLTLIDGFGTFQNIRKVAQHIIQTTGMNPDSRKAVVHAWYRLAEAIGCAYWAAERSGNNNRSDFLKLYTIISEIGDRLDTDLGFVFQDLSEEDRSFLKEHGNKTLKKINQFLCTLPLDRNTMRADLNSRDGAKGDVLLFKPYQFRAKDRPDLSDVRSYITILTDPSDLSQQSANYDYLPHGA